MTLSNPNRRGALIGAAAFAGALAAPASAKPMMAQPTAYGRAILRLIACEQYCWRRAGIDGDEVEDGGYHGRAYRIQAEIEAFAADLVTRPVVTLGDAIDRAVILAWHAHYDTASDNVRALLASILTAGGLSIEDCYPIPEMCPAAKGLDL